MNFIRLKLFVLFAAAFFGVHPIYAQKIGDVPVAVDRCSAEEFSLDLAMRALPKQGVIEILRPLPDTHAREAIRFAVAPSICIPLVMLADWERKKGTPSDGLADYDATFFITFDPKGTLQKSRSRFDYDILMCEELAETPKPPADLAFGSFHWTMASGIKAQRVTWLQDLRRDLELRCEREG